MRRIKIGIMHGLWAPDHNSDQVGTRLTTIQTLNLVSTHLERTQREFYQSYTYLTRIAVHHLTPDFRPSRLFLLRSVRHSATHPRLLRQSRCLASKLHTSLLALALDSRAACATCNLAKLHLIFPQMLARELCIGSCSVLELDPSI